MIAILLHKKKTFIKAQRETILHFLETNSTLLRIFRAMHFQIKVCIQTQKIKYLDVTVY